MYTVTNLKGLTMKQRLIRTSALIATALLAAALPTGTLQASAASSDCKPGDRLCLWDDDTYRDTWGAWNQSAYLGSFGGKASSVWTRSPVAWTLNNRSGVPVVCVLSGASEANLRNFNFTDQTYSITRRSGNHCPVGSRIIS